METIEKRFFIGGLDFSTTSESLKSYFSQFGELKNCEVVIERKTGKILTLNH